MKFRRQTTTDELLRADARREAAAAAIAKQLSNMILRESGERRPDDVPPLETVKILEATSQPTDLNDKAN